MGRRVSRREFVKAGASATVVAAVPGAAVGAAPTVLVRKATPPVVIASANGHKFKNGGPRTCVEEAFTRIVAGEDVLDALMAGVNAVIFIWSVLVRYRMNGPSRVSDAKA